MKASIFLILVLPTIELLQLQFEFLRGPDRIISG